MTKNIKHNPLMWPTVNNLVCLSCDTVNESEFYRDGVCGNCQTLAESATPCPQHEGGYDCSPFCPSCAGAQFVTATPSSGNDELTDTDSAILLLCRSLDEIREAVSALRIGAWVSALSEACELLKTHAGDSDLSGIE